jgi:TonB family protein
MTPEVAQTTPPVTVASIDARRARQSGLLAAFVGVSFAAHVAVVLAWFIANAVHAKPALDLDEAIVKTRLVKLGKERPPDWLPRIDAAPAPPPPSKKSKPQDDKRVEEKPAQDAKEKPSTKDILKSFEDKNRSVTDIIKDRIGEQTDEGKADGDKDGTALTGEIKKTYFSSIIAAITRNMEISNTITDEERIRLHAVLQIKIDADGTVLEAKIGKSSGSTVFDNDVLSAAKRSSPLPAPPPPVKDMVAGGVGINFCPVHCS